MAQPEGPQPITSFESLQAHTGEMVMYRRIPDSPDKQVGNWEGAMVQSTSNRYVTLNLIVTDVNVANHLKPHSFSGSPDYYGPTYEVRTPTEDEKEAYRGRRISYGGSYEPR